MKSTMTALTIVAIALLFGHQDANAAGGATSSGPSRTASNVAPSSSAGYTNFVGDDAGPAVASQPAPATFTGFAPDHGGKGLAPRARKGCESCEMAPEKDGAKSHGEKGGKGGDVTRSWFYDPWIGVDYLHAWLEGRSTPPLLTTSPPGTEGVLPDAQILFGSDEIGGNLQAAGRLSIGAWLDECHQIGVGGEFFALEGEKVSFSAASDATGAPLLARPFFETSPVAPGGVGPASFLVSGVRNILGQDFVLQGEFQAHTETDVLGAEGYVRYMLIGNRRGRLDLIGGYHFTRVDDYLRINTRTEITPGTFGRLVEIQDAFDTRNKFHGGELGLLGEITRGSLSLSLLTKASLGNMNQVVTISGQSAITDLGGNVLQTNGGILALPTNIGTYKSDEFAVIPEAELKLTWSLTEHVDLSIGYTVMYWSDVALAADQIELRDGMPVVNSSQWFGGALNGPADPTLTQIHDESLWLHGLNLGVTVRM